MVPPFAEDGSVHVLIESPRGSTVKLKYDEALDRIALSRPLPIGLAYPYDWGIVPGTRAPDGDPLDAMVIWDAGGYPGIVIPCRPIGVLNVEQTILETKKVERNDRFLMVPVKALRESPLASVF